MLSKLFSRRPRPLDDLFDLVVKTVRFFPSESDVGLVLLDKSGKVLDCSCSIARLLGYAISSELRDQNAKSILTNLKLNGSDVQRDCASLKCKDGEQRPVQLTILSDELYYIAIVEF